MMDLNNGRGEVGRTPSTAADLRAYGQVLWLRRRTVLLLTTVVFGSALLFSFSRDTSYGSSAEVLVQAVELPPPASSYNFVIMEDELRIANSAEVTGIAADKFATLAPGEDLQAVSFDAPSGSNSLIVQAVSTDPELAQYTAQAYSEAYIEYRTATIREAFENALEAANQRVAQIQTDIEENEAELELETDPEAIDNLELAINGLEAQKALELQNTAELRVTSDTVTGSLLLAPATPGIRLGPDHFKTLTFGLLAGLALGVGLAFLQHRLDERIYRQEDLEESAGAPVLAMVPRVERGLVVLDARESIEADAFRSLRSRVLFAASRRHVRTVMVTSPHAREGKTTTAANLAVSLAIAGKETILVGADLRRGVLDAIFPDLEGAPGLSDLLSGTAVLLDTLVASPLDHLRILPSGPVARFPSEKLGSDLMGEIIAKLEGEADFVVLDTTPVLATTDAVALATHVESALLVVEVTKSVRPAIARSVEELRAVGTEVMGLVLTNFDPDRFLLHRQAQRSSYYYAATPNADESDVIARSGNGKPRDEGADPLPSKRPRQA